MSRATTSPRVGKWRTPGCSCARGACLPRGTATGAAYCTSAATATAASEAGRKATHSIHNRSEDFRGWDKTPTRAAILGPDSAQKIIQVSGNEAFYLKEDHGDASWEEQINENHAVGRQLSWNGDEVEAGFHAALILCDCVAHGQDESPKEDEIRQACDNVDGL